MSQENQIAKKQVIIIGEGAATLGLPRDIHQKIFSYFNSCQLSAANGVCRFWYHEANVVAMRKRKQLIPNDLFGDVSNPILIFHRLEQLLDLRDLVFYEIKIPCYSNILRDIRYSSLIHHALCYPYIDDSLNRLAEAVFQENELSGEILMRVKNYPGIDFLIKNPKDEYSDANSRYVAKCYRTNNVNLISNILELSNPEDVIRSVQELNCSISKAYVEFETPELRDLIPPPKDPCQAHSGYEKLEASAKFAPDSRVFDAIIAAFPWDSSNLVNNLVKKCATQCYVQSPLAADAIFPGWREFDHEDIDEVRLLDHFNDSGTNKYFLMYAIIFSGHLKLFNKLLDFLMMENQLRLYPDYFLGALLVFLVKHRRLDDAKKLQDAVTSSINDVVVSNEVIVALPNLPQPKEVDMSLFSRDVHIVTVDKWPGMLKQFSLAIFRTILLYECDEFHYLLVNIMSLDNSQLVNYFLQSVVMRRLFICRTLILDCKLEGANIPEHIDERSTSSYQALQRIAAWSGYFPIIKMLYSHGPEIPEPELFDLDVVISGGCVQAVDHLLSINPSLKLEQVHLTIAATYGHIELFEHLTQLVPHLKPNNVTCKFTMVNLQVPMMQYLLENYPELTPREIIFTSTNDYGFQCAEEERIIETARKSLGMNAAEELDAIRRICQLGSVDRLSLFYGISCFTRDDMRKVIEGFQQKLISHI